MSYTGIYLFICLLSNADIKKYNTVKHSSRTKGYKLTLKAVIRCSNTNKNTDFSGHFPGLLHYYLNLYLVIFVWYFCGTVRPFLCWCII